MYLSGSSNTLVARQTCYPYCDGYYNGWYSWGRWVLLGAIIVAFVLLFAACSCINARRRRKQGATPFYGTGWMAPQHGAVQYYGPNGGNQQPQQYYNNNGYGQNQYDQNQYGQPQSPNQGYYGQQTGIELQSPQNTYQAQNGGDYVYGPPPGPPPPHKA